MSVRSDILADIEAVLGAIPAIQTVKVGSLEEVDLEEIDIPVAFVLSGPERKIPGSTEHETWEWTVIVETWCKDTAAETLYAAIHSALAADYTRGGKAINCERTAGDILSIDPGRALAALQQTYTIEYRHPTGTP